jgi:hypothetical protein
VVKKGLGPVMSWFGYFSVSQWNNVPVWLSLSPARLTTEARRIHSGTEKCQFLLLSPNFIFRLRHTHQPVIEPADDMLQTFDAMPRLP